MRSEYVASLRTPPLPLYLTVDSNRQCMPRRQQAHAHTTATATTTTTTTARLLLSLSLS